MRVQVLALRNKGRNLNKSELEGVPRRVGVLRVREMRDIELNRPSLQARLFDPTKTGESDLLPALEDARLLYVEGDRLRITGIERLADADVAQTWDVELDD
jgi:hypothetical protein